MALQPAAELHEPTTKTSEQLLAYFALAISIVGVGSAFIFVRVSEVDPTATLMLRMVVATAIVGAMTAPGLTRVRLADVRRRDVVLLVVASLISGLDLLANHWAVTFTSVANTVFLMDLTPAFVLMFSWLVLRERTPPAKVMAVPIALVGSALMILGSSEQFTLSGGRHFLGEILAIISAALYAAYLLMTKDLRERLPTSFILTVNSFVITVLLAPLAFATSSPLLPQSVGGYLVIFAYAVVSQLLGHGLMAYALRTVNTTLAAISTLLRPVVAVLLAWLLLGETIGMLQVLGAVVILVSLAWFQVGDAMLGRWPRRRQPLQGRPGE